jgi:hypothetical protein
MADTTEPTTPRGEEIALTVAASVEDTNALQSGQATARKAVALLVESHGFIEPTALARRHLAMAFAGTGKVVYGNAFDVLQLNEPVDINWSDLASVEKHLGHVRLFEVKSTKRPLNDEFDGFFFSLSTAELLVAQSLGSERFGFVLVNTQSEQVKELSLTDLYARTKAIYPSWSIRI